jgi:transposase InsO family protein
VPRKRSGESSFPSFLEPHKRSEKALLGVVMEAYVNGVSTRKVDHLVSELVNRKGWNTRIELASAIHDYIELFHNTRRRHSALGMLTPTEYGSLLPFRRWAPIPSATIVLPHRGERLVVLTRTRRANLK